MTFCKKLHYDTKSESLYLATTHEQPPMSNIWHSKGSSYFQIVQNELSPFGNMSYTLHPCN